MGNQRPQTSTWTVTGDGAVVLSKNKKANAPVITEVLTGSVVDVSYTHLDVYKRQVIDLETENLKSDKAVELSLSAMKYLKMIGAQKFYYKYSSNFYRALKNNVGQISKALMDELGVKKTILCPAFPEKGYMVKMGIAYINGEPISENKEYSLNKNESEIAELMTDISPYPVSYTHLEGISQHEKGVHILDVNVGLPEIDEKSIICEVVTELQVVSDLPLQIDTVDAEAMEAAMRLYNGKPMVNSVNGNQESMDKIFQMCIRDRPHSMTSRRKFHISPLADFTNSNKVSIFFSPLIYLFCRRCFALNIKIRASAFLRQLSKE